MGNRGSVLILGGGTAGRAAGRSLASSGWDVTLVERDRVGGLCLWRGCMPKKALYHAARVYRTAREAEQFGVSCGTPHVDWQGVLAWKWHAQETYAGDQPQIVRDAGMTLIEGEARFVSETEVSVGGKIMTPDHIIIATGSHPVMPPIPGVELTDTSDDALRFTEIPDSLLIVGGGYIGMEFAAIYASFGTSVTIVSSTDRLLPASDPDAAAVAQRHLERMGVSIHLGCRAHGVAGEKDALEASWTCADGTERHSDTFSRVLMATGRRPALEDLDLEVARIDRDEHGHLVLDESLRTTNERVWAAGDAADAMMQTPVANYEGRLVAASIDSGEPRIPDYASVPTTVFTVPQIAQVGLTETQAREAGISYRVGTTAFEYLGAAIIEDDRDGLVKLIFAEDDGRLIGAHLAGPTAGDMIHGLALAVRTRATQRDIADTLGVHPSYSEAINWAAS